ncbi:hypothetical protein CB1_001866027 [Camelus ferus]|nr:hypothetical protein CB1_001866027 [Camelus ferus]
MTTASALGRPRGEGPVVPFPLPTPMPTWNSQMLDEDDVLNETPKSSSVDLPVETTGDPQLESSTEIAETQPTANSVEVPQSCSATTLHSTEVSNVKTGTQRNKIPTEELGKASEHKLITKGTRNKDDETRSCSESRSSAQGKSFHDGSQRSHPQSSSGPCSPETSHTKAEATDAVPHGSEEHKVKRTSCMYGANCYRKNPVHFQHFSHPGDGDYGGVHVTCQDEADGRPECPYGASCYSEYPLDDSFLDDEEEEYEPTDEDSDWEPGKEDLEKEDMEELLKEAQKFMKRKK